MLRLLRALALLLAAPATLPAQEAPVAITGVTVIDVESGQRLADQTVIVRGNRIAEAGAGLRVPDGARVVDGAGKFLIPGLWDAHVHAAHPFSAQLFFPLLVANGVTGVRDMWGVLGARDSLRREVVRGSLAGPRFVTPGHILDGVPPIWPGSSGAGDAATAERLVDSLAAAGAAFIKVYSRLEPDVFRAVVRRARERGLPFAGHVPTLVSAEEASDLGQASVEHLTNVAMDCSGDADAMRAELRAAVASAGKWDSVLRLGREHAPRIARTFDRERCRALAARFARNGTRMVPTLQVLRSTAFLDDTALRGDPRLRFIPSSWSSRWNPASDFRFRNVTPEQWAARKRGYERSLELVRLLHEAGVTFLAGTDLSNPYIYPGFSLHDELGAFVALGFSPLEALRAATLEPVRYLGLADSLGAVARGKVADLVLLDADPLTDIRNTARIAAVIADGRLYDREALDRLLGEAERRARAP